MIIYIQQSRVLYKRNRIWFSMIARSKKRVPLNLSAVDLFVKPLLVVCFELVCQLHLLKQIKCQLRLSLRLHSR